MENETISTALEAALKSFQAKNNQVPQGYFDQFEQNLMRKIHAEANTPKQAKVISFFAKQKKYLVAASLLFAVATGFLFYNQLNRNAVAQDAFVQIEALPDNTIEAYLNENEVVAEVDWNSAIETAGASISLNNN
jgi:hypothetical protein